MISDKVTKICFRKLVFSLIVSVRHDEKLPKLAKWRCIEKNSKWRASNDLL